MLKTKVNETKTKEWYNLNDLINIKELNNIVVMKYESVNHMLYEIYENGYKIYPGNIKTYIMDLLKASSRSDSFKLNIKLENGVLKVFSVNYWGGLIYER